MKSFTFNLLPKKSKEQAAKEETRDRSSVYTAILPLVAVLIWLGLVIFNAIVVGRVKANWQSSVNQKENRIKTEFLSTIVVHGEFVKKTQALDSPVQKDIKPEVVFRLSEELFPTVESDVSITSYDRNRDGGFAIGLETNNLLKLAEILRRFTMHKAIDDVKLSSASYSKETNKYTASIGFVISDPDLLINPIKTP